MSRSIPPPPPPATADPHVHLLQELQHCFTCGLTPLIGKGVCLHCARTCHAGHQLSEVHYNPWFFCDCGAEGWCSKLQQLRAAFPHDHVAHIVREVRVRTTAMPRARLGSSFEIRTSCMWLCVSIPSALSMSLSAACPTQCCCRGGGANTAKAAEWSLTNSSRNAACFGYVQVQVPPSRPGAFRPSIPVCLMVWTCPVCGAENSRGVAHCACGAPRPPL